MLVSAASMACRALLAQGAAPGATAAATAMPALCTAVSRLAPNAALFTTSAFARKAAAEPATHEASAKVMMHPGMVRDEERAVAAAVKEEAAAPAGGREYGDSYLLMHPVYDKEYLETVRPTHKPPKQMHEKVGYAAVQALRSTFDFVTGYGPDMSERKWLARFLYLESIAGVPGMVAGMLRHLRSLRTMRRDNGWIHTLLEEAENERMHLLTFMQLRQPGPLFRASVIAGQAVFFNAYIFAYTFAPRTSHAFVGYLEEEAVKTYSRALADLDDGKLPEWSSLQAPDIAKFYWRLGDDATMRDLLLAVRADENCHRHVNHIFSAMHPDDPNPTGPGSVHVP